MKTEKRIKHIIMDDTMFLSEDGLNVERLTRRLVALFEQEYKEREEENNINKIVNSFIETLDDLHNRGLFDVFKAQNKELIEKLNYFITQAGGV